jgi:hypothetical protein
MRRVFTFFTLLIPAFSLLYAPAAPYGPPSQRCTTC